MNSKNLRSLFYSGVLVTTLLVASGCDPTKSGKNKGNNNGQEAQSSKNCSVAKDDAGDAVITCPDGSTVTVRNGIDGRNGVDGQDGADGQNGIAGVNGSNGVNGTSCSVTQTTVGALIQCTDGTSANVLHGSSCTVAQSSTGAEITCADGTHAIVSNGKDGIDGTDGVDGVDGVDGSNGANGLDGKDGTSCSIVEEINGDGALVTCGSGTVLVKNGKNGVDGRNGKDGKDGRDGQDGKDGEDGEDGKDGKSAPTYAYQILDVINPCGAQGDFDEVLLRFANGDILAHFASGDKQYLTRVKSGFNYITTDGYACRFSVDNKGVVTDEKGNSWKP